MSVAVHVTVLFPTKKNEPDKGLHKIDGVIPLLSVAEMDTP